jgi:hypothetical protein
LWRSHKGSRAKIRNIHGASLVTHAAATRLEGVHFALELQLTMDKMVNSEWFFQLTHAKATNKALQASVSTTEA